jgi:hypothetical protein
MIDNGEYDTNFLWLFLIFFICIKYF